MGTWPECEIVRYDGGESWTRIGRTSYEREVMWAALYNGKCYFGTLPMANVFRMDENRFKYFRNLDNDPSVYLRRVWSMSVHDGQLFAGTLPQGKVLRRQAGRMATLSPDDFDLDNDAPLHIGSRIGHALNGSLRDVRLYSRALEKDEIRKLATARSTCNHHPQ